MPNLQAITKSEFAKKSWQRNTNLWFAAEDAVCPLSASELPQAMMCMPLAFLCTDGEYSIVGLQGLEQGNNYFLDDEGKWKSSYLPAAYRGYPFVLATNEAELILCIDEDSGLLIDDESAEPFFDQEGEVTTTIKELMDFLSSISTGMQVAARICESLSKHELFKPWELQFELENGTKRVEGLFCIDEAALKELPDKAYAELRLSEAIPVIYCQLLSMQRISYLTQFAQAKSKADIVPEPNELNLDGVSTDGNISFENL
jgi:hypothetical protein